MRPITVCFLPLVSRCELTLVDAQRGSIYVQSDPSEPWTRFTVESTARVSFVVRVASTSASASDEASPGSVDAIWSATTEIGESEVGWNDTVTIASSCSQ